MVAPAGGMMNLAESMKYVLKNKTQSILGSIVKDDLRSLLKNSTQFKKRSLKDSFLEVKGSIQTTLLLVREIPNRINEGFRIFAQELIQEMERLPDQKQRTKFCMKVLAGLSKLALSSAYDVGFGDIKLLGFGKGKNIISRTVVAKVMFKSIQSFIIKFIEEIEKEITDPGELKNIKSFKDIVLDDSGNAIDKFFDGVTDPEDRAFVIVENFKNYILTGK